MASWGGVTIDRGCKGVLQSEEVFWNVIIG